MNFNRRDFLKTIGVTGAAVMLNGKLSETMAAMSGGIYLIVRTVDVICPTPILHCNNYHKGDVTSYRLPGENVGLGPLKRPDFLVIHVPDLAESEARTFLAQEPGERRLNPYLRPRAFAIDLDGLSLAKKPFHLRWNGREETERHDITISRAELLKRKIKKAPFDPPDVIGAKPEVLG